jgi:hypothetical protein
MSKEVGIHAVIFCSWRNAWRLQEELVPASGTEAESYSATDKFTVVLETAGHTNIKLGAYCR